MHSWNQRLQRSNFKGAGSSSYIHQMIRITRPIGSINGALTIPGSKSISNRVLILNETCRCTTQFFNLSDSDDTRLLVSAIERIKRRSENVIDIGHGGTDMRFLTAFLATNEGEWVLTGSERMKERPIGDLIQALRSLGAEITCLEKENY